MEVFCGWLVGLPTYACFGVGNVVPESNENRFFIVIGIY